VDGDQSLLVDTLFDMHLTRDMLDAMADASGVRAEAIGTIVNTHANGDHCHGNGCCPHAEIIASEASAKEMAEVPPAMLATVQEDGRPARPGRALISPTSSAPFDFDAVEERLPTQTFTGRMDLTIGDKTVELIEVGPAHTGGDVIVHVPQDRTVFTGDILFIDGTPLMWAGPVKNWINACDRIIGMDAEIIVPGHGPVTDKAGVQRVADYLAYIDAEARKRYDAGLSVREAALDIALGDYANWGDAERVAVNVDSLYREYRGDGQVTPVIELFALMAEARDAMRK
jgi:cyclase